MPLGLTPFTSLSVIIRFKEVIYSPKSLCMTRKSTKHSVFDTHIVPYIFYLCCWDCCWENPKTQMLRPNPCHTVLLRFSLNTSLSVVNRSQRRSYTIQIPCYIYHVVVLERSRSFIRYHEVSDNWGTI